MTPAEIALVMFIAERWIVGSEALGAHVIHHLRESGWVGPDEEAAS